MRGDATGKAICPFRKKKITQQQRFWCFKKGRAAAAASSSIYWRRIEWVLQSNRGLVYNSRTFGNDLENISSRIIAFIQKMLRQ